MKTCYACNTELKTPIEEYGPLRGELCRSCFLKGIEEEAKENLGPSPIKLDYTGLPLLESLMEATPA